MADQVVTLRISADGSVAVAAIDRVVDSVKKLGEETDKTSKKTSDGNKKTTDGFNRTKKAVSDVGIEATSAKASVAGLLAVLGGVSAIGIARALVTAADSAGQLRSRMLLATTSAEDFAVAQERIERVARSSYKSVADITEVFVRSAGPMRQLGFTTADTLDLTEALSLSLVVSAANANDSAVAIGAFSRAMQMGKLGAQEFQTVLNYAPSFFDSLEKALGKTRVELLEMVEAGGISTQELSKVSSQLGVLRAQAESMPATFEDAMTRAGDSFMKFADDVNTSTGAVDGLVRGIDWLGQNLPALSAAALAVASVFATKFVVSLVASSFAARSVAIEMGIASAATLGLGAAATAAGRGMLALVGGPIGLLAIAIGAVAFAWQAVSRAEDDRIARFNSGIVATNNATNSLRELNGQLERAKYNNDELPNFAVVMNQWASSTQVLIDKQAELAEKRGEIEELEARIAYAQTSNSEGAGVALLGLLPRIDKARGEYDLLADAVNRLGGELDALNFDQFFDRDAAAIAGDQAAQAFALLTAGAKSAEQQIEKTKQGQIGYWQELGRTRIAQAEASGATAAQVEVMKAENAAMIATIGSTLKKTAVVKDSNREAEIAAQKSADYVAGLVKQAQTYGMTSEALARYELSIREGLTPAQRESASAALATLEAYGQIAAQADIAAQGNEDLAAASARLGDELADIQATQSGASAAQIKYNQTMRELGAALQKAAQFGPPAKKAMDDFAKGSKAAKQALDLTEEAESLKAINTVLEQIEQQSPFQQMTSDIDLLKDALEALGDPLDEAFDQARADRLTAAIKRTQIQLATYFVGAAKESLQSLQSLTTEGSKSFQVLQVAIDATTVAEAVLAVVHQASQGDVYTAIPRMIAVAAAIASLGVSIGNVAGSGFSDTAAQRQATQGTGSVLGDAEAKSESIANAVEITANASEQLVGLNRGMLNALNTLVAGLGSASNMLARGAGEAEFGNLAVGDNSIVTGLQAAGLDPFGWFSGSSEITDQGIVIFGGALTSMLESIAVGAYQEVQSTSWLFGSTQTNEGIVPVSDAFATQFQLVIGAIIDTVREGALALGLLPEDVQAALDAFAVEEIRISLEGLSAEEAQAELQAVFSQLFDGLAGSVVPFIAQFQQVGEGLGETLVRVATEVQVMQEAIRYLGLTVDETDPERFAQISDGLIQMAGGVDAFIQQMTSFTSAFAPAGQDFEIAAQAVASALGQVGLAIPATRDAMFALMQSLDATTESGREQIATLLRITDAADQYYSLLDDAVALLDEMGISSGQLSEFGQALQDIQASGREATSAANAIAIAQGRQGASAIQVARISRWTAEQMAAAFRRLQEETRDIIAQLYGGIAGSLDGINEQISELESITGGLSGGIGDIEDASASLFDAWASGIQTVQDYLDSMLLGDLSALTPEEQLAEAQRQLIAMQAAAVGGDANALAQLPQLADAFLRLLQGSGASGEDYNTGFQWVRDLLGAVVGMENPGTQGGPNTVELVPSAELLALYAARDAAELEAEAARRADLARQLTQNLADWAIIIRAPVLELIEAQGVSLHALAEDLGVVFEDLGAQSIEALGFMATTLGVSMTELTASLGLTLTDLGAGLTEMAASVGIDLTALTAGTTQTLAALAGSLGLNLTEIATALNVNLGALADSQSLISQALESELGTLPDDQRTLLEPLFQAIADATSEADANAAIDALEEAVNLIGGETANALAPYLDDVFPVRALEQLDYLAEIDRTGVEQLNVLNSIRSNLSAANAAAGLPSYAVGTGYVRGDQIASIHDGEAILPANVNAFFRSANWNLPTTASNDQVVVELRSIRERIESLERSNNAGHGKTADTVGEGDRRAIVQRDDIARRDKDMGRSRTG